MGAIDRITGFFRKSGSSDSLSPLTIRPVDSYVQMGRGDIVRVPLLPLGMRTLYDLYYYSDILRTIVRSLTWEIVRNGIELVPKFAVKCEACGAEYAEVVERCSECNSDRLRKPNYYEKKKILEWFDDVNLNDQSIMDVLMELIVDIAVSDNAYLVVVKEYIFDSEGRVVGAKPIEILRGSPMKMRIVMNKHGRMGMTDDGQVVAFCLEHRDRCKIVRQEDFPNARCDQCGKMLVPAYYATTSTGGKSEWYYTDGEVLHIKLFTSGVGYGLSPLFSIWVKLMILMKMDWFILMKYHYQRPTNALLILRGQRESIRKAWEWLQEQARLNPHQIAPLVVEGSESGSGRRIAEFLDLTVKSDDIDFIQFRDELRKAIGAVYGVTGVWVAGSTGSGGLSNESMQIIVSNRTIETWHTMFNAKVFSWLLKQIGVSDWILRFRSHEIRDELAELELQIKKAHLANAIKQMGYKPILVKRPDGRVDFDFESEAERENGNIDKLKDVLGEDIVNELLSLLQEKDENVFDNRLKNIRETILARLEGDVGGQRPKKREQRAEGEPVLPKRG